MIGVYLILNKLYHYYHTIKYLHFKQILFHVYYKMKRRFIYYCPSFYHKKLNSKCFDISHYPLYVSDNTIYDKIKNYKYNVDDVIINKYNFLNIEKNLGKNINWNSSDLNKGTRLWKLNLNYHEYLIDVIYKYLETKDNKYIDYITSHIQSWIDNNPIGTKDFHKDNWNSYAISNRVIAWIKIFRFIPENNTKFKNLFLKSLRLQLEYLYRNLEYDLRANHLLENGFALLFGAYFFEDTRLLKKAKSILENEIKEQILNDGFHIELSPMYQQHIAYRFLDSYNLIKTHKIDKKEFLDNSLSDLIKYISEIMLGFLEKVTFKNGDIPLLNDSAFNVYPTTKELLDYAEKLAIQTTSIKLEESGYRKYQNKHYECIVNIGGIKAHYMPGHAHSDIFNFILYVNDKPFIIDTGISTYDFGERRMIERSTVSHNTVQIRNFEQAEIWSSFRVAKRANAKIIHDSPDKIKAELDYVTTKAKHTREFVFKEEEIKICDQVNPKYKAKAYLHFHPDVEVDIIDNKIITNLCEISVFNSNNYYIDEYMYAPEFNVLIKSKVVIVEFNDKLETQIKRI